MTIFFICEFPPLLTSGSFSSHPPYTYHYQTSDILINSPLRKDTSALCINSGIYSSHRIYLQAIGKGIGSDDDAGASVGILLCF